jgi:hypothetical protein
MSTSDIVWIVLGLGLIIVVFFAQGAGISAGSYLKNRNRKRDEETDEQRGYFKRSAERRRSK